MSELIDFVNSRGDIVEYGVERDDAKDYPGLHMQIVIVVVIDGLNRVLVHERASTKSYAGLIDHACGGVISGETPEVAGLREVVEENALTPKNLRVVSAGVNEYNRYRYLLLGESDEQPRKEIDLSEVAWVAWYPLSDLRNKEATGEFRFVEGFFEDIELALHTK